MVALTTCHYSLKLKRPQTVRKYRQLLDDLYANAPAPNGNGDALKAKL
jgi:long-chain acyl-CoA synthetase